MKKYQVGLMVCDGYEQAISYANRMFKITGIVLAVVEVK
jgi:hypothetical protein